MRLLIDMDGVIADFDRKVVEVYKKKYPQKWCVSLDERQNFYIEEDFYEEVRDAIKEIYTSPGFYESLHPIRGSLEALSEMDGLDIQAFICTSPLSKYENCVTEKYRWVDRHLGKAWVKKIIMTKDKTLIKADILVDDKPSVTGVEIPSWKHVLYSRPYNKNVDAKRRLTWKNWKEILLNFKS